MPIHIVGIDAQIALRVPVPHDHLTAEELEQAVQSAVAQIPKNDQGLLLMDEDRQEIIGATAYFTWDVDGNLTGLHDFTTPPQPDPGATLK